MCACVSCTFESTPVRLGACEVFSGVSAAMPTEADRPCASYKSIS